MLDTDDSRHRWLLIGLLIVVAAVYARAVTFGHQMGFDDNLYLFHRPEVRNWWGVSWWQRLTTPDAGYWIPVPTVIYAHLRLAFPDLYVQVVHGVNLALHLLNVGLVYALVRRWSNPKLGLVITALWALHPVHVESVVWLTSLKVLVYGSGVFTAMLAWDYYIEGEGLFARLSVTGPTVMAGFLVALGCKPEAVILPALIILVTWFRRREWRLPASTYVVAGAQIGVAAVYLPMAILGQDEVVTGLDAPYFSRLWFGRIFHAFEISIGVFLFPINLSPGYFALSEYSFVEMVPGLVAVVACLLGGVAVVLRREWRLVFGLAFAAVTYLPYAQLKPIPRLAADSYLYLPAVGATTVVVLSVWRWLGARNDKPRGRRRWWGIAGAAVAICLLAVGTHFQVGRWRNPVTLWKPVLIESPSGWRPYSHVAAGYTDRGKWELAASVLEHGLPYFRASRVYPAFMPIVFEHVGRPEKAWRLAGEAIARHRDPKSEHYEVYLGLLARNDLPLPSTDDVERLTEKAIDVVTDNETWMSGAHHRVPLARYFARHGHGKWALPFLRHEFQTARPNCAAWVAYRRLPEDEAAKLESVPRLPDRCRSDSD